MISIVTPFFNEEAILEQAVRRMVENLQSLPEEWELIAVNDGSRDASAELVSAWATRIANVRLVSYDKNHGRGYALLQGIRSATGTLIFTTEIDGSWGADIVHRMYEALQTAPEADIVVASPHVRGGGYRNVPLHRVLLSRYGNYAIRAGLDFSTTMNTGMTRGYRREAILSLPLFEEGKEFHLEVLLKALAFGKRIIEIPAVLEWGGGDDGATVRRKSSSRVGRLVGSHLHFSLVVAPVRYLWLSAGVAGLVAMASGVYALIRFAQHQPYAFAILGFAGFLVLATVLFSLGVLSEQNRLLMRDVWRLQAELMTRRTVDRGSYRETAEEP